MFLCSLIEELCAKEENFKTGCNFNFGHECSSNATFCGVTAFTDLCCAAVRTDAPCMHHETSHSKIQRFQFENLLNCLNQAFNVDDLFLGATIVAEPLKLTTESVKILREGGMNLRKFQTNSRKLRKKWLENIVISLNSDIP